MPIESGFKDGSSGSIPVKDTLTFSNQAVIGTLVVSLPDGAKITLVTAVGESADTIATDFVSKLPSGWTAAQVGGIVTISGPAQAGYTASTTNYVKSGATPLGDSDFKLGDSTTPTSDTLTFSAATAVGTFVVTLPDTSMVTMVTAVGESANEIATEFANKLPSPWTASVPIGGAVTISAPSQASFSNSYASDFVPTPPTEGNFQNGNSVTAPVSDTLTFHDAHDAGTVIVTLPDKAIVTLDIVAGTLADATATDFVSKLPNGWTAVQVGGTVTISGPAQSGYSASSATDVVSGALPSESGFLNGRSGVQGVTDTLTFGSAISVGNFVVTLPDGVTKVPIFITSAPRTAVQVASAFQSALPVGWDLISQIGNVVTFSGPSIGGQPSTATDGVTGALPVESGFVDGSPVKAVTDNLAFSTADETGTIVVILPDGVTKVTVVATAGESANDVAIAFSTALAPYSEWSASVPVDGNVAITGPALSGFSKSIVSDGVSGALPDESGFLDGIPIASVEDNLAFGQAKLSGNLSS